MLWLCAYISLILIFSLFTFIVYLTTFLLWMLSWINDENGFWCMKVWLHESIKSESNKLSSHRPVEKARKEVALGHKYSKKEVGCDDSGWNEWKTRNCLKKSQVHIQVWKIENYYFCISKLTKHYHMNMEHEIKTSTVACDSFSD